MSLIPNFINPNPPAGHKYKKSDGPIVSVLMAVYKTQPQRLRMAIDSILAQTFKNFELIILNDYPDDVECEQIINSYNDPRIKYYKNDVNMGIAATRNKLIEIALASSSKYILTVDHDDEQLPTKIEKLVAVMDANPDLGICGAWWYQVSENGTELVKTPTCDALIKIFVLMMKTAMAHSSMVRKSILTEYNIRYDETKNPITDVYFILDIMSHTHACNVPEPLMRYYWYDQNTSNQMRNVYTRQVPEYENYLKTHFSAEYAEAHMIKSLMEHKDSPQKHKIKKYKLLFNMSLGLNILLIFACAAVLLG